MRHEEFLYVTGLQQLSHSNGTQIQGGSDKIHQSQWRDKS